MQMRLAVSLMGVLLWATVSTALAALPESAADKRPEIAAGSRVMLSAADVMFRSRPSPDAAIADSLMGRLFEMTVEAVEGDWLRIGAKWVRRSDTVPIEAAIEYFTRQIEQQPTPFAYASRAVARMEQPQFDEALADAEEAVRLDPKFAMGYVVRGGMHRLDANLDAALKDFDKALALEPKLAVARLGRDGARRVLLLSFASLADPRAAGIAESDVKKLPDEDRRVMAARLFDRATHRGFKGEHRQAIADLEEAVRLAPELRSAGFFSNRGGHYLKLGEYKKAAADLREAIEREPEIAEHYESLGAACEQQQDWDGAIEHYSRAYEILKAAAERQQPAADDELLIDDPSFFAEMALDELLDAYFSRAEERLTNGDEAGATADYNCAVELAPKSPLVRISRAMFLAEAGKYDEALKDCDVASELDPTSSDGLCGRGAVHLAKGDFVSAMNAFNRAATLFPQAAEPLAARADAWIEMGELSKALDDLNQAIVIDPDNPLWYVDRAKIFRELKRGAEAAADEKKARELFDKLSSPR
ncbi:MAG TPA: tetratricopeptide repeat protein [Pirellulales bacterium]|nr:tetratricopeptide repeat protein [Pirellulales bacterium]